MLGTIMISFVLNIPPGMTQQYLERGAPNQQIVARLYHNMVPFHTHYYPLSTCWEGVLALSIMRLNCITEN